MEENELIKNFKENPTIESLKKIVNWCSENVNKMDLTNKIDKILFEESVRHIMKHKKGNWSKNEAKMAINFFAKTYAIKNGIENDVTINILENDEYYEKFKDSSRAVCVSKGNGTSEVYYSSKVVDNLMSEDDVYFIRGLQTVFHEVVHSKQYSEVYKKTDGQERFQFDGKVYKLAVESITKQIVPKFYKENYINLLTEYEAEYYGLEQTMEMIRLYSNPNLFKNVDKEEFLKEMINIDGKSSYEKEGSITFQSKDVNAISFINFATEKYVEKKPEIINEIPVLQYAFNLDGKKKSIIELIEDRDKLIKEYDKEYIEKINDLYMTIANYRKTEKKDIESIDNYILKTGTDDEFVFDLLRLKLENTSLNEEQINQYMDSTYRQAELVRIQPNDEENIEI